MPAESAPAAGWQSLSQLGCCSLSHIEHEQAEHTLLQLRRWTSAADLFNGRSHAALVYRRGVGAVAYEKLPARHSGVFLVGGLVVSACVEDAHLPTPHRHLQIQHVWVPEPLLHRQLTPLVTAVHVAK